MKHCYFFLFKIFGIIPTDYVQKSRKLRITQITIKVCIWIILTWIYLKNTFEQHPGSHISSVLFTATTLTIRLFLVLNTIICITIVQNQKFMDLLSYLEKIEASKCVHHNYFNYSTWRNLKLLTAYLIFTGLEIMECFVWEKLFYLGFFNMISYFYILMINTMTWSILTKLCEGFHVLNCHLQQEINDKMRETNSHIKLISNKEAPSNSVETWGKLHLFINRSIMYYNDLFGVYMFVFMLYIMTMTLNLLREFLFEKFEWSFDYMNIILLTLYQISEMIVLVRRCDKISNLRQETTLLAYEAANYTSASSEREEKFRFAQQTAHQCVTCSAAGYFEINNSLLFTSLQLITTYIIVLIQFR